MILFQITRFIAFREGVQQGWNRVSMIGEYFADWGIV
jgi:hypothetical protein